MQTNTSHSTVNCHWKKLLRLVSAILLGAALLVPHSVAAAPPSVVATISGGGTASMEDGMGRSIFGLGVKLLSDGSATGHIHCVDQEGSTFPGNIFGEVTTWSTEDGGATVVLNVIGKFVPIAGSAGVPGGHPQDTSFTVRIQQFGGAGVGHWTLEVPGFGTICYELLTSGQIVLRLE